MEEIVRTLLSAGPVGAILCVVLFFYYKKDQALIELHARYAEKLSKDNAQRREMNRELVSVLQELRDACEKCGFRKFVERLGGDSDV